MKSESYILQRSSINKGLLVSFLLIFLILYLYVANEIIWSLYVVFLIVLSLLRKKLSVKPSLIIIILFLPLIWGFLMSIDNDTYNTAKGFFYLSIPIIMVLIGLQLSKLYSCREYLTFIRISGDIIAILFIFFTIIKAGFVSFISPYTEARFVVGSGSPACVLSLIIAVYSEKFGFKLFRYASSRWLSILINLTAIYLFASRTYWVMLLLFFMIFSFKTMKKENLLIFVSLILGFFVLIAIWINSRSGLTFDNSILYKLVNSFTEIRIHEFKTPEEINTYFRGFEAFRSWETYASGNILELCFGGGFGQMVILKTSVLLDGKYWTSVPWIHNGFLFVLVKQGALGLIFIFLFFLYLVKIGLRGLTSKIPNKELQGLLVICCGAALFMTNFVDCGLYNFEMTLILITTGFLLPGILNNE
jgi:hypothetical protein